MLQSLQVTMSAIRAGSQVTQELPSPADAPVQTLLQRIEGCLRGCFQLPILNHLSSAFQHRFIPSASNHQDYWTMQKKISCRGQMSPLRNVSGDGASLSASRTPPVIWGEGGTFASREASLPRTELRGLQRMKVPSSKPPGPCSQPGTPVLAGALPRQAAVLHWLICTLTSLLLKSSLH